MDRQQVEKLRESLGHLGSHIRLLEMWARRDDTDPGLRNQVRLTRDQFNTVSELLPPKEG